MEDNMKKVIILFTLIIMTYSAVYASENNNCYKDNILLNFGFVCLPLVFLLIYFLTVHLNHFRFWPRNTISRKQN